jgi:tetratricopeptide (TPR) repeat protein
MRKLLILMLCLFVIFFSCSKKESAVKSDNNLEPPALLQKGDELFTQGSYQQALSAYESIYTRYPTSREYISAVIGMAKVHNTMGNFERGFELLHNLIRENMVPSRVPEIYNEMARYYEVNAAYSKEAGISNERADFKKAMGYYRKAVKYPNSDDVQAKSYAQFRIGELHLQLNQFEDAALAYQSTAYNYPETQWGQLAEQKIQELRQSGQTDISPIKSKEVEPKPAESQAPAAAPSDTSRVASPDTTMSMESVE